MPPRITATKNLTVPRYDATARIDTKATSIRSRFATTDKYQIYADKRDEAVRFLSAVEEGTEPDESGYPYLLAETGITAATMIDLAYMWLAMDSAWKSVASLIEKITIEAKIRVREASSVAKITRIEAETAAILDALGDKPPDRPKPPAYIPPSF